MKRAIAVGGLIAACAVCCAVPFLLPFVGLSVFGGGLLFGLRWDQIVCAGGAVLVALVLVRAVRASRPKACSTDGSCGCKPAE